MKNQDLHTEGSQEGVVRLLVILTGLGIVGNIFVSLNYMCILKGTGRKSIDIILIHLTFINIIMLLSKGMTKTLAAFGLRNSLYHVGCKILGYLERVARGLSICTTSLLIVVQAITISPRSSRWGRLQPRSAWHLLPLFLFCWILNSLISMNLPFYIKNISSMNTSEISTNDNYCYFLPGSGIIRCVFFTPMVFRDAVFQGAMGGTSVYMVSLLHNHHQHVLHLQTSKILYRSPREVKAAQSILLLMFCFLFFYWADCFISLYSNFFIHHDSIARIAQEILTLGYAILSPLVLIHRDGHLAKCRRAQ
uniref:LOW QUALITY PROTEIN: putative vomeronasal receptor-like protein 4 n=1 Tax=Ictidomys tridecemlineatus TaxID=43179 RepID=UPI000B542DA0|nr:LOW QUALITY PROTEIN: putative vomeronasal receptor-like protein 4 [Ictidomys tridecemlineatus]